MEALRLNEYITEKGLYINSEQLKRFQNRQVEIIILPLEERKDEKTFMKFAGILEEDVANKALKDIDDCRKIDKESWL